MLELETDKATIEVPSSVAGKIMEVKVKVGDKVKVGQAILSVEMRPEPPRRQSRQRLRLPRRSPRRTLRPQPAPTAWRRWPATSQASSSTRRRQRGRPKATSPARSNPAEPAPAPRAAAKGGRHQPRRPAAGGAAAPADMPAAPAAPSVRRMARELGVDINQVSGSGPKGRISVDDVKEHAKRIIVAAQSAHRGRAGIAARTAARLHASGARSRRSRCAPSARKTAEHLTRRLADDSARHPARLRRHHRARGPAQEATAKQVEAAGGTLTVTAVAVKIVAAALKVFPAVQLVDRPRQRTRSSTRSTCNIGVAVDTDRGLLVPVIRDADKKNMIQIAVELAQLSEKARTRKISLDEMQGGCFSVSNLGGIGGSFFTPIVNAPEVAILGISRGRMEPVYDKETGAVRAAPAAAAVAVVRSSRHRRRRRHPLPALGGRSVRAAVRDGASRITRSGQPDGREARKACCSRQPSRPSGHPSLLACI